MDKRIIRNSGTLIFFAQICTFEIFDVLSYNEAKGGRTNVKLQSNCSDQSERRCRQDHNSGQSGRELGTAGKERAIATTLSSIFGMTTMCKGL